MGKLDAKVAVVTGASKGMGAAIAKRMASQGASVVVNYASSKDGAEKVVADIVKAGGKAMAVGASVAKPEEIDHLFAQTKKAYGKVNVLVNNAGVYSFAPLETLTAESIAAMFTVNVTGLLLCSKAALPLFPPEGGSIINIGSIAGEMAPPAEAGDRPLAPEAADQPTALEIRARPLADPGRHEGAVGRPRPGWRRPELPQDGSGGLPGAGALAQERTMARPGIPVQRTITG